MLVLMIIIWAILGGLLSALLVQSRRTIAYHRELSALRRNAADIARFELQGRIADQRQLQGYVDGIMTDVHGFLKNYNRLRRTEQESRQALGEVRRINADHTTEFAKLLQRYHAMEAATQQLRTRAALLASAQEENLALQIRVRALAAENAKLAERNLDLEYAINLESVSMIESYQERDKLFCAIDGVRRSLIRILNPA